MGHHYEESDDDVQAAIPPLLQFRLFYCGPHARGRMRLEGLGCSATCDETIDALRASGMLEEIRRRIMAVVEKRDVEPMGTFEDCVDAALGLKPRGSKPQR